MSNLGVVKFSKKLLAELLFLPEGAKVVAVRGTDLISDDHISLYVESEEIPSRKEGEICPEVEMEISRDSNGKVTSKFRFNGRI